MTQPVPTLPDVWWEDLQVGSHWQTRSRTITEPEAFEHLAALIRIFN